MLVTAVILAVLIVVGATVLIIALKKSREGTTKTTNYRVFYILGIVLLPLGIVYLILSLTSDYPFALAVPFIAIGSSYITIGLANKDKWEKHS